MVFNSLFYHNESGKCSKRTFHHSCAKQMYFLTCFEREYTRASHPCQVNHREIKCKYGVFCKCFALFCITTFIHLNHHFANTSRQLYLWTLANSTASSLSELALRSPCWFIQPAILDLELELTEKG